MKDLNWLFHRLSAMSIVEINYRVQQKARKLKNKKKYKSEVTILDIESELDFSKLQELKWHIPSFLHFNFLNDINYTKKIKIFNKEYDLEKPIMWHEGMFGTWPSKESSYDITFRNKDDIGDIRFTWEINRHLFFVNLALQYKFNHDPRTLAILKDHFYDWIEKNPFLKGVNWSSSMEIAIRSYQWLITYTVLNDIEDEEFLKDLLKAIKNSTQYVMNNLSLYSSANNHLILEVAISSIIGYFIKPIYCQSWFEKGYQILKEQIPLQIFEDGVNKEQAVHYHAFVVDMLIQYNLFLQAINQSPIFEEKIYKMIEFLGYLKLGGSVTEVGDSDDAKILDINGFDQNYYDYILQLASIYYQEEFVELENLYPEVLLFNHKKNESFSKYEYKHFFELRQGGYEFINHNGNYLIFDVGPLGFGTIAAHGHADALSVVYHYNNQPVLIDSGTYIYNIESSWRNYFRKTSSHNTLSENEKDQSFMNGPFLWSKKANVLLIDSGEKEDIIYMIGEHDGYLPKIHSRAITYMKEEDITIIADKFTNEGQINFTFDNKIKLGFKDENNIYLLESGLYISFSKPYKVVDKWISKRFLEKEKGLGVVIKNDFSKESTVYTFISKQPVRIEEDIFSYNEKLYKYDSYKNIELHGK